MLIAAAEAAFDDFLNRCAATGFWRPDSDPLITALSGGPDSMALALIADKRARARNIPHRALIIDHGLRDNSSQEAQQVAVLMRGKSIATDILKIGLPRPVSGHQEWAREHRLKLLAEAAYQQNSLVLFGHHGDDQNETVAMRLSRHSGLRGLKGIAPLRFYKGALFARPFLSYAKADLSDLCTRFGVNFISDPSNQDRMFERVRWRSLLAADPDLARQLGQLSRAASSLSAQLDGQIKAWINAHVRVIARLRASCPYAVFSAQPEAHRHHILAALLAICGHSSFPPSMDAIAELDNRLASGQPATLASCKVRYDKEWLVVEAEFGRKPANEEPLAPGGIGFFDGRWMVWAGCAGKVRRLGSFALSDKDISQIPLPEELFRLPKKLQDMIPILQTLDDRLLPPHFKSNSLLMGNSKLGFGDSAADKHPFIIWPAPMDRPVRL